MDAVILEPREGDRLSVPRSGLLIPGKGLLLPGVREPEELFDRLGKRVAPIGGGAFSSSGMYLVNWIDILDATQLAIDLSLTTHKWALYTHTLTPNSPTDAAYSG